MMRDPQDTVFLPNPIDAHTHSIRRCCIFIDAGEGQTARELSPISDHRTGAEQLGRHGVGLNQRQSIVQLGAGIREQCREVGRHKPCGGEGMGVE
jgi:hypothetical protein